jgi:mRNA interferase RelE/StbE
MYSIRIKKNAQKQLAALPLSVADRVAAAIDALALTPRPAGATKLQGYDNIYRIRTGSYRIVYRIEDKILTIEVVKIGHRREVYKGL